MKLIEKYKIKKIGGWGCFPWLLFLIFFFYGLYDYFTNKNFNWYLIIPIGAIGLLMLMAQQVEEGWQYCLQLKGKEYNHDEYIYTDSKWEYYLYKTAKVVAYLFSFVTIGILGILLSGWIGSISIAPTTIIIILLIIIIMRQNNY